MIFRSGTRIEETMIRPWRPPQQQVRETASLHRFPLFQSQQFQQRGRKINEPEILLNLHAFFLTGPFHQKGDMDHFIVIAMVVPDLVMFKKGFTVVTGDNDQCLPVYFFFFQ